MPKPKEIRNNWSINDFKKAVWQYLEEHGKKTEFGLSVNIIIKSKKKFWGKIAARRKGYKKT